MYKILRKDDSPETIKAVVAAVDCEYGSARVRFGYPPVPLQDYDFGPDLIVDLRPLVQHLLYMVLDQQNHCLLLEQCTSNKKNDYVIIYW